jgi:hypothetical protein
MSNPWNMNVLRYLQDFIRFLVWIMLVLNSLMLCIFSTCVLYKLLTFTWKYLLRKWFDAPW